MKVGALIGSSGFENLKLGDHQASVRERFGDYRTFRRTPSAPETDHFTESGVMATYDQNSHVVFIEITPPANPTIRNRSLIGRSLDELTVDLQASGISLVRDAEGAHLEGLGIGLYAPSGNVEALSVGELSHVQSAVLRVVNGVCASRASAICRRIRN